MQSLVAFESLARNGSTVRAAHELCLTHGAVGHRVRLLESHLGYALFRRERRRLTLTSRGRLLHAEVSRALGLLEKTCASPQARRGLPLRVSVTPAFASNWLLSRLPQFSEAHPEVRLEIHSSYDLVDFAKRDIDLAIRYGTGDWPGVERIGLVADTLFPVCSPRYAESVGGLRRPRDLSRALLLRCDREPWTPWFAAAGLAWPEPGCAAVFDDYNLMLGAAVLGQGVALGRSMVAERSLAAGELVRLFDTAIRSPCSYFLVYPRRHAERPGVQAFAEWMVSVVRRGTASQAL